MGEGPFPSELDGEAAKRLRDAGHEYGTTTGRPRRAGNFDAVQVRYGLELAGAASWIMTKLDVLSGLGDIDVVTGYRVNGERYEEYPAHLSTIDEVETEVETLPGWTEDGLRRATSLEELPETARRLRRTRPGDRRGSDLHALGRAPSVTRSSSAARSSRTAGSKRPPARERW